jgi:DNA-directed RNA polymerase specialized sigma24 family protein
MTVTEPGTVATTDGGWDRLEVVYRREHAPMVRLAHLLVRDRGVAEELVQDAFLRLHARLDEVDPTDEVARLLATRPSPARSLIRRGLASLKKELEP